MSGNSQALGVAYTDQVLNGALIDNSVIGGTTPAAATFTAVTAASMSVTGAQIATGAQSVTLTNASATPGTVRAMYGKQITGVSLTSGNLVGDRGEVTITNGTTVGSGVYLYGVQGKVISGTGTINAGSGYVCGMLGQLDLTGGTNTSGHIAGVIASIQGVGSDGTPVDLFYGESATGTPINSMYKAFGKATFVFDLTSNVHTQMSTTGTAGSTTGKGWLKCNVEGVTRYIPLTDSVS